MQQHLNKINNLLIFLGRSKEGWLPYKVGRTCEKLEEKMVCVEWWKPLLLQVRGTGLCDFWWTYIKRSQKSEKNFLLFQQLWYQVAFTLTGTRISLQQFNVTPVIFSFMAMHLRLSLSLSFSKCILLRGPFESLEKWTIVNFYFVAHSSCGLIQMFHVPYFCRVKRTGNLWVRFHWMVLAE